MRLPDDAGGWRAVHAGDCSAPTSSIQSRSFGGRSSKARSSRMVKRRGYGSG